MKALFRTKKLYPDSKANPYKSASFLSRLTFTWISELIQISGNRTWDQELNYNLSEDEHVQFYKFQLEKKYKKHKKIIPTILHFFKKRLLFLTFMSIISSLLNFSANLITTKFFSEISENKDLTKFENLKLLIALLNLLIIVKTMADLLFNYFKFTASKLSQVIKAVIMSMIQDKICNFSTLNSVKFDEGYLTNLVQVDSLALGELITNIFNLIGMIVGVIVATGGMIFFVGVKVTLIIEGIFILVNLLNFVVYFFKVKIRRNYLKAKDKRMTFFQNVVEKIEFVKIRGLENFFSREIYEYREEELGFLKQNSAVEGILTMLTWFSFGVTGITMMLYYAFGGGNEKRISFATFTGLNGNLENMRGSFAETFIIWSYFIGLKVNVKRIDDFLNAKEIDKSRVLRIKSEKREEIGRNEVCIQVRDGNFKWRYTKKEEEEQALVKIWNIPGMGNMGVSEIRNLNILENSQNNFQGEFSKNNNENFFHDNDENTFKYSVRDMEKNSNNHQNGPFALKNLNFDIKNGEKIAVIGASTSGKSSLLYSLLGEMIPINREKKSKVVIKGKVSYLSQKRWIIGDTIKENITLGSFYDEGLMEKCLQAAQFFEDLNSFEEGLDTVLSDSGDSVSGGQRARIALARCFYHNPDIFLLDDPTSSLDNTVSNLVMKNITENPFWNKRTFIISTSNFGLLHYFDKIIFVKSGKIAHFTTPENIKKTIDFIQISLGHNGKTQENEEIEENFSEKIRVSNFSKNDDRHKNSDSADSYQKEEKILETFFLKEDREKGKIKFSFIMNTLCSMGGAWSVFFMVFSTLFAIAGYAQMLSTFAEWGEIFFNQKDTEKSKTLISQNIAWTMLAVSFAFFRTGNFFLGGVSLGRKLHSSMTFRILHARINEFLKRTPIGRILNRFSFDIMNADFDLSAGFDRLTLLGAVVFATAAIIVSGADNYLMIIPLLLFSIIAVYARRRLMNASGELFRLDAITKSPFLNVSTSCIVGSAEVRSFGKEEYFEKKFERDVNENLKNSIMIQGSLSWFNSMIYQLNFFFVLIPCYALFLINLRSKYDPNGDSEVNKKYLFLQNVLGFSGQFGVSLLVLSTIENSLISIERCRAYEKIPFEEGYFTFMQDNKNFNPPSKKITFQLLQHEIEELGYRENLLRNGEIELVNLTAKYPTTNEPVLKKVNLRIEHGQKVGIVGRTGAGKSSFIKLFWRSLNPSSGNVIIGGQDITELDLKKFRKEINIITQDSNIIKGTLLSNITHKRLSPLQINRIRDELFKLGFSSSKLREKNLGFEVSVNGDNLSQSEKQILCLLRALEYKKCNVVVMDEATAFIDERVEREFQKIVMEKFFEATVLIIAHRISNVVNCDRVLVFDNGKLAEDGDPKELIKDKRSRFYELWRQG